MKKPRIPPKQDNPMELFENKEAIGYLGDKEINNFIHEMNRRYLSWDELFYRHMPKKANKELIWRLMKFNRSSNIKRLSICDETGFGFKFNITDTIQQLLHTFDMNLGGNIGSTQIIPSEDKDKYLISSIMEEAIASSQLEGASTTRKIAKEMLKSARKPKTQSEKMILNNYLTSRMIKDSNVRKLTPEFILKVHESITKDTLEDSQFGGKFRESDDIKVVDDNTGEIFYNPPDYKLIKKLIDSVCNFVNNDLTYFIHPIIKASILHFLIGYIHPFVDGNGRTARSLFYWYLSKEGYWIIEFMSISRIIIKSPVKYAHAYLYSETDNNDLTYFINYQLRTMKLALEELKEYITRKIKEKEEIFNILQRINNINERQAYMLKEFYENPKKTLTIRGMQETFNVVYQTARQDLLEMEIKGFLNKKVIGRKQLMFFRSSNFIELIDKKIN